MPELYKVRSITRRRTMRRPLRVSSILSLKLSLIFCSTNSVPLTHLPGLIPVFSTQCGCWALLGSRLPSLRPGSCHWVENRISGLTLLSLFTFSGNSVHVSQVLNSLHVYIACVYYWGFSSVTMVENPSADTGDTGPIPGSRRCPGVLPGESHGQRSLVGYSAWGRKELDTTERLNHHHRSLNQRP